MSAFPGEIFDLRILDCLILETGCAILKVNAFCWTDFVSFKKWDSGFCCDMDLLSEYCLLWIIEHKFINFWASQPSLAFNIKTNFFVKGLHMIKSIILKSTCISIFSFPFSYLPFLLLFNERKSVPLSCDANSTAPELPLNWWTSWTTSPTVPWNRKGCSV